MTHRKVNLRITDTHIAALKKAGFLNQYEVAEALHRKPGGNLAKQLLGWGVPVFIGSNGCSKTRMFVYKPDMDILLAKIRQRTLEFNAKKVKGKITANTCGDQAISRHEFVALQTALAENNARLQQLLDKQAAPAEQSAVSEQLVPVGQ